jgi:hypothetical protein
MAGLSSAIPFKQASVMDQSPSYAYAGSAQYQFVGSTAFVPAALATSFSSGSMFHPPDVTRMTANGVSTTAAHQSMLCRA